MESLGGGCWVLRMLGGSVAEMSQSLEGQLADEWVAWDVPPRDYRYGYPSMNNSEAIKSFRNVRKRLWLVPAALNTSNATTSSHHSATSTNVSVPTSNLTDFLLSSLAQDDFSLRLLYSGYMPQNASSIEHFDPIVFNDQQTYLSCSRFENKEILCQSRPLSTLNQSSQVASVNLMGIRLDYGYAGKYDLKGSKDSEEDVLFEVRQG